MPVVKSYRIVGGDTVHFSAWEATEIGPKGYPHHTIQFDDVFGAIGEIRSRPLPDDFDEKYPIGIGKLSERVAAAENTFHEHYKASERAILALVPELTSINYRMDHGRIIANYNDVSHLVDERGRLLLDKESKL